MLQSGMEKFDVWLNRIHASEGEFDYRAVYFAYLHASDGRAGYGAEAESRRLPDGSFEIRAGRDVTIALADDTEREALVAHMIHRYCGDRYPSMAAWEAQQQRWHLDDRDDWTGLDGEDTAT